MKKYLFLIISSICMNTYAQTPTNIEGVGYKFIIDLPKEATHDFKEVSFIDESGKVEYKSYLQILMNVNNRAVSVIVDKANFDKEQLKTEWLTDDQTNITAETDHSIIIRTYENETENHHLVFQKMIDGISYLFVMYYQLYSLPEVQEAIKIFETARE